MARFILNVFPLGLLSPCQTQCLSSWTSELWRPLCYLHQRWFLLLSLAKIEAWKFTRSIYYFLQYANTLQTTAGWRGSSPVTSRTNVWHIVVHLHYTPSRGLCTPAHQCREPSPRSQDCLFMPLLIQNQLRILLEESFPSGWLDNSLNQIIWFLYSSCAKLTINHKYQIIDLNYMFSMKRDCILIF